MFFPGWVGYGTWHVASRVRAGPSDNALTGFQALGGYHLLEVDGTGQFASERVHCANCCEQRHREGRITYYHQLLAGVLVHPSQSTVVPAGPGADREGRWPVEERLRTDGGEAVAGTCETSASALEAGGDAGCVGSHRPAVSSLSATRSALPDCG